MMDFLLWVFEAVVAASLFFAIYSKAKYDSFSEGFVRLWEKFKGDGFH